MQLAEKYLYRHIDSARQILKQCIQLAERNKDYAALGDALSFMGTSYYSNDDYDSALIYYQKAETEFEKDTSPRAAVNIAANRMSMGTAWLQRGDHQKAIQVYLEAINILEKFKDYSNLVTAYANIGLVYNDLKQFDKALHYHQKALDICYAFPTEAPEEATAQVQMLQTLDYLNLKQYDRALVSLHRSDSMAKALRSDYISTIYYGMEGKYYHEMKQYQASVKSFEKSLHYADLSGNQFQKASSYQQLGINFFLLNKYKESIDYLLRSITISRKIGDKIRERKTLEYLSQAYARIHQNEEAVNYYQQFIALSDSLNQSETKKRINEIENQYQSRKKADSILVLKKNNQLQLAAIHRKETLNIALITGGVLLLLIGFLFYRYLRHKHQLLKNTEELHRQRIQEMEKERQLVAVQSVLKGQEEERSRLAKDLHDGVGGLLSGVKFSLSTMKGNVYLSEDHARAVNKIIVQLDQSINELRRVSHNMMPEALIKYGLKEALENYCENLNLGGELNVRLQAYGLESRLEQSTEIVLYRIVQELLNNVIKHAEAKNVLIQLVREEDRFSLTVEDDGKGFIMNDASMKRGAGLANIKARVDYLGGTVDFNAVPGEGTSVNIVGNCS